MEIGNKGYTLVDNENVLENDDFNIQEQSVYIAILSYHNKARGYSYPSYGQLKARSKISDTRTLQKHVTSLIKKGYIRKETVNGIGCRYYILKSMEIPSGELHYVEDYTRCKTTPPPSGELHHDPVENYTTTNTNTSTNKKTIYSASDYEYIWSLYPNKKGKAQAMKKIPKLLNQYGKETLVKVIERYTLEIKDKDKQYIKHGNTFFNGGYVDYLDENYQEDMKGTDKSQITKEIIEDLYK